MFEARLNQRRCWTHCKKFYVTVKKANTLWGNKQSEMDWSLRLVDYGITSLLNKSPQRNSSINFKSSDFFWLKYAAQKSLWKKKMICWRIIKLVIFFSNFGNICQMKSPSKALAIKRFLSKRLKRIQFVGNFMNQRK